MHNIADYISEPIFRDAIVGLEKAKTKDEIRAVMDRKKAAEDALTPKQREAIQMMFLDDIDKFLSVVDEDIEELRAESIRKKIGDLDKAISFSYIARTYFGKSQSWLTQRLNGCTVNGKEARFNRSELLQLQNAIHDLGRKLSNVSLL